MSFLLVVVLREDDNLLIAVINAVSINVKRSKQQILRGNPMDYSGVASDGISRDKLSLKKKETGGEGDCMHAHTYTMVNVKL